MYKTVRQGDASLQYTILPQVDQFYANELSSITAPPMDSPVKGGQNFAPEERFRVTTGRMVCFGLFIVATFVSFAVGVYLIDEMVCRRCGINASKPTAPLVNGHSSMEHVRENKNDIRMNKNSATTTIPSTSFSIVATVSEESEGNGNSRLFGKIVATTTPTVLPVATNNFGTTMSATTSPSTPETLSTLFSSTEAEETASSTASSTSSSANVGTSVSDKSTDSRTSVISPTPTNNVVNILKKLKTLNIPQVTLKLTRITDTVPKMYLKTGIASYKKGKITTSVLSEDLTLEELIFKTPDGTINPWPEKWPFAQDVTETLQRKGTLSRDLTALALLMAMLGTLVLLVIVLRLVRPAMDRRQYFEGIQTENQDEAHSTLLDTQTQDPEDKD